MSMDSNPGTERPSRTRGNASRPSERSRSRRPNTQEKSYHGRFLHDTSAPQARRRQRRRRRRSASPLTLLLLGTGSVALLIISIVLLIHSCVSRNPLVGRWSLDQMTSYVFYEGGTGALEVPRGRYTFTYTIEDELLTIDFHDDKAEDSEYVFEKDGDTLTLVGGNHAAKGTYVLHLKDGQ